MIERIKQLFTDLEKERPNDWDYYRAVADEVQRWYEGAKEQPLTYYRENVILRAQLKEARAEVAKYKPYYDAYYE